jgi:hypothetical protein
MKHLSTVARVVTPLAMVVFLAYEINQSMIVDGWWVTALLIGSIATAIGIEITGILAGKALEGFWRLGDKNRTILSLALLSVYTIVAVYILRHNQAMVLVPIIAAIVYLLSSLTDSLEMVASEQKEETAVQTAFELEQAAADKELERELKRQKQADNTALKLAKLEVKAKVPAKAIPVTSNQLNGQLPGDFRLLTNKQKDLVLNLTSGELAQVADISDSTARRWKRKVTANGYHK